jgi:hypothetical protein
MNTKIGTTFGLALLMAIAVIATMYALGLFSATEVRADHDSTHVSATQVGEVTFTPGSSNVNAKTSWDVTFGVSSALTAGSGTIAITFPNGVVLPATIDKSRVSAGGNSGTSTYGMDPLTADPTVAGQTVTLTVPATNSAGSTVTNAIGSDENVKVSFSQLAGIVNPAASGAAGKIADGTAGKVNTSAQTTNANITATSLAASTTFAKTIAVDKITAAEDDTVTVTFGGFTPGTTLTLTGDCGSGSSACVSGSGVVGDDRKAVIAGTMKSATGKVGGIDTSGGEITAANGKTVTIKPTLTATASGKPGDTVTLTGKNYTASGNIPASASITFGGTALSEDDNTSVFGTAGTTAKAHVDKDADGVLDDFAIAITIPSNATKGANQVKVIDAVTTVFATATVEVDTRSITIEPTSGPPGTVIVVSGSGFPASRIAAAANTIAISPVFGSSAVTNLFTDGAGALPGSDQFTIPAAATASTVTVTVTIVGADGASSTAAAKFTVGNRVLTLVPDSGPRGTKFLVSGTKFTASGTVTADTITTDSVASTHVAITLTSAGDVPATTVTVPKTAGIGSKTVSLTDSGSLTGTAKFNVTQPTISLGQSTGTMGQIVSIGGAGWVPASSVTISLQSGGSTKATVVTTASATGTLDTSLEIPSTVGVGLKTITYSGSDTLGNDSTAVTLTVPKPVITLSTLEAEVGDTVTIDAEGFTPSSGLSKLEIGGADVRSGVSTSDALGNLSVSFVVPGLTGSQLVTVKIGATAEVSTSISVSKATAVVAASTDATEEIFADVISNSSNLVRVWRFSNATQEWDFYDPRDSFASANTLLKSGSGDIVWVNVNTEQEFTGSTPSTLYAGWNLVSLN